MALLAASYGVTFSLYTVNKLTDQEEDAVNMPERYEFVKGKKWLLTVASLVFYGVAVVLGGLERLLAVPVLLVPVVFGGLYSVRLTAHAPRLKDIVVVKNVLATLGWVLVAALLPMLYSDGWVLFSLVAGFLFIKLFINAMVFDIRDVEGDTRQGIHTVPAILGTARTERLLISLNSVLFLLLYLLLRWSGTVRYAPVLLFSIFYGYGYILYFCRRRDAPTEQYDLLVDGEWIWLGLLFFLVKCL